MVKDNLCVELPKSPKTPENDNRPRNPGGAFTQEAFAPLYNFFDKLNKEAPDVVKRLRPEQVTLPMKKDEGKLAFVLDGVFTEEECKVLVDMTEDIGYEEALVNVGFGKQVRMDDVRNSTRCMVDSPEFGEVMWNRIKTFVPGFFDGRHVIGLNERMRFLRYHKGEYFKPHCDGAFVRQGEMSLVTVQLYLRGSCNGGATRFLDWNDEDRNPQSVAPIPGRILVFEHRLYHEGQTVRDGEKYSLRTDVMYRMNEGEQRRII